MGEKPLTWQQIVAVLICVFVLFPAAILAWGGNIEPEWRTRGFFAFWVVLTVIIALLFSHFLKVNRTDLQPDMLAQIFPTREILQLGPIHLWLIALQSGGRLRLLAVVQNTCSGDGGIRLTFEPMRRRPWRLDSHGGMFMSDPPPLDAHVPPASIVIATLDLALQSLKKQYEMRLYLGGDASAAGETMRFGRRRAITKRASGWTTLAVFALGGHYHGGGGTFLPLTIKVFDPALQGAGPATPPMWTVWPLWSPARPMEANDMAIEIRRLLERGMVY